MSISSENNMSFKFIFLLMIMLSSNIYAQKRPYIKDGQPIYRYNWKMVYSEEFRKEDEIDKNWISQNSAENAILSSRWRENLRVSRGKLIMSNRKEKRGGKEWTTANLISKEKFKYGFFECRMRISGAPGINNAFWLNSVERSKDIPAFEIDVVECHYPNIIRYAIHNWGTTINTQHSSEGDKYVSEKDLVKRYHIYGLYWDEAELMFFFDGKLIWKRPNEYCFNEANILLSTAVLEWAGEVTDAINGTSMNVDYVRVYKQKNE